MTTYTMNLTKEEHMQLKLKAVSLGLSIKDYLLSLFKKDNETYNENVIDNILNEEKNINNLPTFKSCDDALNYLHNL